MVFSDGGCVKDAKSVSAESIKQLPDTVPCDITENALAELTECYAAAQAIVGPYQYDIVLAHETPLAPDTARLCFVAVIVDTKGIFPGVKVLAKICRDLSSALHIPYEAIKFCGFPQS